MTTVAAIILAGGQSSRMGTDKAMLSVTNQTLLGRTARVALDVADVVAVVTPWPERYVDSLPAPVMVIPEPLEPGSPRGPVAGLLRGMQQVQADWILALACDLPRLQADSLCRCSSRLPDLPAAAVAYLPHRHHRWEPLCGFYRGDCGSSLAAFVAAGGRSFQRWLAHQVVQPVEDIPAEQLFNLNTPADWQRLQS